MSRKPNGCIYKFQVQEKVVSCHYLWLVNMYICDADEALQFPWT